MYLRQKRTLLQNFLLSAIIVEIATCTPKSKEFIQLGAKGRGGRGETKGQRRIFIENAARS